MKVLVITSIDFRFRMHQRTHDLVNYLSRFHEVTVIHNPCLIQNGNDFSIKMLVSKVLTLLAASLESRVWSNEEGRKILLVGTRQLFSTESQLLERHNLLSRIIRYVVQPFYQIFLMLSPALAFFVFLRPKKYDVCVAEGPWAGIVSILLRKGCRVRKVVYEDLDFFPAYVSINLKNKLGYYLTHWIERNVVKRVDLVVSVGNSLKRLRKSQGARQVYVLSNGYLGKFLQLSPDLTSNTVVYAGALTDWSGVDRLIEAVKLASKSIPDIRLLVVGDGPKRKYLEGLVASDGMRKKVEFLGKVPYEEVGDILAKASVGAAVFIPSLLTKYVVMCKLMDYLGAGLPILATDFGENGALVRETETGVCVKFNPWSIANGIIRLLQNPRLLAECSMNARTTAKDLAWGTILSKEAKLIEQISK